MAQARETTTRKASARKTPATKGTASPKNDIPPLEWAAAGIGLCLAVAAIGMTAWDAAFGVEGPPAIEVRLTKVTATPYGYVAQIEALNHGGAAAAQVVVEGELTGATPETANATFDYIPEQSGAQGGLMFEHDPRAQPLKLRAKGFVEAS